MPKVQHALQIKVGKHDLRIGLTTKVSQVSKIKDILSGSSGVTK
jgi:hypothetical protein